MLYNAYFLRNWEFSQKNDFVVFCYKPHLAIVFRKLPISQKLSIVERQDQLFWIPRIILHQNHSLPTGKKFLKFFFYTKMIFLKIRQKRPPVGKTILMFGTMKNFDLWVGNRTTSVSSIVLSSHVIYKTTRQ